MYNDELDMILESAYEDGYYQALADMGYEFDDDEASEDVDIFDEDCFDDAVEGTAIKKVLAGIPGPLTLMIGNIIHNSHINKSVVASLGACQQTYGVAEGKKAYNKTMKFFIENELLSSNMSNANIINYTDLTPRGKKFMHGYYSAVDEIRKFDINAARANVKNSNKENTSNAVMSGLHAARTIAFMILGVKSGSLMQTLGAAAGAGMIGHLALSTGNTIVGGSAVGALIGMIPVTFNIIDGIKSAKAIKEFRNTMNASEDVDIFDEDCFDEAVETGEAKRWNKAMKRAYVMQKAGIDTSEVDRDKPLSGATRVKLSKYRNTQKVAGWDRHVGRRNPNAGRERRLDGYGKDYTPELIERYKSSSGHGFKLGSQEKLNAYKALRNARDKKYDDASHATSYRAYALHQARRGDLTDDDLRRLGKMSAKQYHSSN